jgi:peptidoglycan-N-acetylglucosamine deacetylase
LFSLSFRLPIPQFNFTLQLPPMRNYLVKTPRLMKAAYSSCLWSVRESKNEVFLTFDDGPHPTITPFVLDQLKKYNAKATFFCIGKNVIENPEVFARIKAEGHSIGNHTHNHFNGWKVENADYLSNINEADTVINSKLFRPPYGRIRASQIKNIKTQMPEMRIIMWDVLTGDFDIDLSPEKCLKYAVNNTKPGSIIVFHDSEKAFKRLEYSLPRFLQHCNSKGWSMNKIEE